MAPRPSTHFARPTFMGHPQKAPYDVDQDYIYLPRGMPCILFVHWKCYGLYSMIAPTHVHLKCVCGGGRDTSNQWEFKGFLGRAIACGFRVNQP